MSDATLMFVHALTGLHPGSDTALGVVDLPVQRERHTQWPTIPGSSLKGVMRAKLGQTQGPENDSVLAAFGPETGAAHDHAGAVSFTDARLLAFPVRSLTGVFAWVSCAAALTRLGRDLGVVGVGNDVLPALPEVGKDKVACSKDSPLVASRDDGRMMLEEFEFDVTSDAAAIAGWVAERAVGDEGTKSRIRDHFAVLHDDDFSHFARNATEVVARVRLDYESKTVHTGALFYEEYVPAETLFYSLVMTTDSRRKSHEAKAPEILQWLQKTSPNFVQIGGGETVGKGLCSIRFMQTAGGKD